MPSNTGGPSSSATQKLDKINLLLYSSGMAFLLMVPLWIYYDLPVFLSGMPDVNLIPKKAKPAPSHSVAYYFFMNGTVHFAQNIIAFVILSSTSPVTYSIASLIKRVAVICIAIIWFKQAVHPIQAFGIAMTFTGLYMYNNAKGDVEQGEKKLRRIEAAKGFMLPTTQGESRMMLGTDTPPNEISASQQDEISGLGSGTAYGPVSISGNGYQHHRPVPTPSIHIKTNVELPVRGNVTSSAVLYPSPPLSNDSPPSQIIPLPAGHSFDPHESSTKNNHVH
jgi:solute carrier family 35 protein E1